MKYAQQASITSPLGKVANDLTTDGDRTAGKLNPEGILRMNPMALLLFEAE